jgi:hypothetical protein
VHKCNTVIICTLAFYFLVIIFSNMGMYRVRIAPFRLSLWLSHLSPLPLGKERAGRVRKKLGGEV